MPLIPMVVQQDGRGERSLASTRGCSTSASSFSASRSTTRSRTSSSRSCCIPGRRSRPRHRAVVNCPGGVVYAGLAIYDTMQSIACDVQTVCCGIAMSMGALIRTAGAAGKRSTLPNGRMLIHQPSGGIGPSRPASDIEIYARETSCTQSTPARRPSASTPTPTATAS